MNTAFTRSKLAQLGFLSVTEGAHPSPIRPVQRLGFVGFSTSAKCAEQQHFPPNLGSIRPANRNLAFALDIDGVLKQGLNVLPAALRAFDMINGANPLNRPIPFLLLTNGGGYSEQERAIRLSKDFGFDIPADRIVQAHTVMKSLTSMYADSPILCLGGPEWPPNRGREVMNDYGFRDVYTAHDLLVAEPAAWPFYAVPKEHRDVCRTADFSKVQFKAIMVFHDSRDFGRDIQLMIDIIRSRDGVFGTFDDELPGGQDSAKRQIPVFFSHGDLLWGNDFPGVRFGQGAFRIAAEAIYQATTGRPLQYTVFGKPERLTYEYAEAVLRKQIEAPNSDRQWTVEDRANIWMIGDNPAADIKGANDYGFSSALVRTGVYRDATGAPAHKPSVLVNDVEEAVKHAIRQTWGE
ncbi:hypothetical protein OC846_002025 [Tilletia horrida]|uniref:TIGR01456 family HAD hydrolase n=1 Tax=Tilletia horrida TaxID=155126 RepID=A0AAN6GV04_9BASI|nr:hypothetical protein OC845_002158 [Tilletia horrida]KAK0554691.1 hypothetical protein OC846_002025 [Tilletia horrida]KAK0569805.1 hypothetical protein OC861_000516 [Tilletia horrida]